MANYSYYFTKLLHEQNINADLLMERYPSQYNDPKTLDSKMNEYPSWIKFWDNHSKLWKFQIIRTMRNYDLIQSSTELPIFCLFAGRPYIVFPTGSDITNLVFKKSIKGKLLHMAYRRAKMIIYPGAYMHPFIEKLNLKNAIFIPPPWDFDKFSPLQNINKNKKFTIFHPTTQNWAEKGNDRFLRAFVKICKERDDVFLILVNRGIDMERSIEILKDPSCQGKFDIIPKSVSQDDLPKLYNQADITVDAFTNGSTGLIGQEAMASEKPLIQYVDEKLYDTLYGEVPPIINAHDEGEIYNAILKLMNNQESISRIGKESREWLLKHHNPYKIIKKYNFIYNAIIEKIDIDKIKKEIIKI